MTAASHLRILLTDVHELAGLGAARSLGRAGHRITGVSPDDLGRPPAALSRYVAQIRRAPDPWQCHAAYRDYLLAEATRGDYDAILPVSEASIAALAAVQDALPARVLLLMPDRANLRFTLSKYHATQAALRLGVPAPRTAFISDGEDPGATPIHQPPGPTPGHDLASLRYPLIIKTDNFLTAEGVYRKGRGVRVTTPTEAAAILGEAREAGGGVIAQEHVPGHGVGAFLLRVGDRILLRFAHQRLHEVPYTGGCSSLRKSLHDEPLLALAERLLAGIGYQGVAMVEFRRDDHGAPAFLEINGRLWGSLALALHAGVDFPLMMLNAAEAARADRGRGIPRTAPAYPEGVHCRNVLPGEILHLSSLLSAPSDAVSRVDKGRAVARFFGLFLDPRIHHDYLWWGDPLPAALQAVRVGAELSKRVPVRLREAIRAARDARLLRRLSRRSLPPWLTLAGAASKKRQVLFLCLGNICRSPFAARYWNLRLRELGLDGPRAVSAGLLPQAGRSTPTKFRVLADSFGVDLADHQSREVSAALIESADAIFVMDAGNYRGLLARFPAARDKVHVLGAVLGALADGEQIPDPFPLPPIEARLSYEKLVAALKALLSPLAGGSRASRPVR